MTQENIEKIREGLRQLDDCRQVIDALDEQSEALATKGTQEINSNEQ